MLGPKIVGEIEIDWINRAAHRIDRQDLATYPQITGCNRLGLLLFTDVNMFGSARGQRHVPELRLLRGLVVVVAVRKGWLIRLVFYRRAMVFAALPLTRSFDTPRSIAFKLYSKTPQVSKLLTSDSRIMRPEREDGKWISLEVGSEKDLSDALKWFEIAYRAAIRAKKDK